MKNALIYTVIFAAIQVVVSFSVQGVYMLIDGPGAKMDATGLIITMAVFSGRSGQRCRVIGCVRVLGGCSSGVCWLRWVSSFLLLGCRSRCLSYPI